MFKLLLVLIALIILTGSTGIVVAFFTADPFRILLVFVVLFLLIPMVRLVFGR